MWSKGGGRVRGVVWCGAVWSGVELGRRQRQRGPSQRQKGVTFGRCLQDQVGERPRSGWVVRAPLGAAPAGLLVIVMDV